MQPPSPASTVTAAAPREARYAPAPAWWEMRASEPGVPLAHYLFVLQRYFWKMFAFVVTTTLLALVICYRLTPIYESTATVDIDRSAPPGVLGTEALQPGIQDAEQYLATQVDLIQSDSVLRPVVLRFRLFEREGEIADTGREGFDPSAPIRLKNLKVRRPPNTYLLKISYRSPDRQLAADVANAIAQSYLEHTYKIRYEAAAGLARFMERQIEELRAKMERSGDALARFEKELNIINPEERTNILSARLLELNTEFTRAQADRVAKEAAWRALATASPEAAHTASQREALERLTADLNTAEQQFAEVKAHYGPNHPEYRLAAAKVAEVRRQIESMTRSIAARAEVEYRTGLERERMLEQELKAAKAELDSLNARSFEYQALKREAEGDKKLYEELLRKIREATINASFQNTGARIADPALPGKKPVFPRKGLSVAVAFLLASLLAVGAAVMADHLDNTVRDPEQVERTLNTHVVGTLPMVKSWKGRLAPAGAANGNNADAGLAGYGEAIRTLRNSILLADFEREIRALLVTSATPGEGKSTTAFFLASAHAEQGHRTLLIDGDLRRPSLHRRLHLPGAQGLVHVLAGELDWREATLAAPGHDRLHVLPAGPASHRAADMVGRRLAQIIEEASREYDLIILDGPPLLGFAEPLQMATAVDGVLIVTRAGDTSRRAVAAVVTTLQRLRARVVGVVLNEVHRQTGDGYYYYGYYRKYPRERLPEEA